MRITVLCTDPGHPVVPHLQAWQRLRAAEGHAVRLVHRRGELSSGEILFLVSCSEVINQAEREEYAATLVLHASDLPKGRGWSPHVWAIVRGEAEITVCLLEAAEPVDSGPVWLRRRFTLEGHELLPEISLRLFQTEVDLMTDAVNGFGKIVPQAQTGEPGEYLTKRTPEHSRCDPHKTIAEQFDLLRVVDAERYPAFMDFRGHRYLIRIEKDPDDKK